MKKEQKTPKKKLKLYEVDFKPMYPVGGWLIILAYDICEAQNIAKETITHTDKITVQEVIMDKPKVVLYDSGDY